MANVALSRAAQRLEPGARIELFILDLNPIGVNELWRFCPTDNASFDGDNFTKADISSEGWDRTGQGQLPRPTLHLSNVTGWMSGVARDNNDLVGAELTRIRTFRQFLDGEASANSAARFAPDIYVVSRKVRHDKWQISWQLAAKMDQQGKKLPGRKMWRDYCVWRYRAYDTASGDFDYSKVTCPWTGNGGGGGEGPYYDVNGDSTTKANDACSKQLGTGCARRFGSNAVLPFGGFPGLSRLRA